MLKEFLLNHSFKIREINRECEKPNEEMSRKERSLKSIQWIWRIFWKSFRRKNSGSPSSMNLKPSTPQTLWKKTSRGFGTFISSLSTERNAELEGDMIPAQAADAMSWTIFM